MSGNRSSSLFGKALFYHRNRRRGEAGEEKGDLFLLVAEVAGQLPLEEEVKDLLEERAWTVPEVEEILSLHLETDVFQLGEVERDISFYIWMFRACHQVKDDLCRQGGQDVVDHLPGDGRHRDQLQDRALSLVLADPDPLAHPGAHAEVLRQLLRVVRRKGVEQREERHRPLFDLLFQEEEGEPGEHLLRLTQERKVRLLERQGGMDRRTEAELGESPDDRDWIVFFKNKLQLTV